MTPDMLRSDARNNREQVVAAALNLFREQGIDVPMKDIADRAGVGVGTLYRRFPDRDTLITAVAHAHLTELAQSAETALREEGAAWPALCRFIRDCLDNGLGALASAVEPSLHARVQTDPALLEAREAVSEAITRLTHQAQSDGHLRGDVDARDIALMVTVQIYTRPEEPHADAVARIATIMLDGLRQVAPPKTANRAGSAAPSKSTGKYTTAGNEGRGTHASD